MLEIFALQFKRDIIGIESSILIREHGKPLTVHPWIFIKIREKKYDTYKKATIVSSFTATILIIVKLAIGIMSGSVALCFAIDSVLDLIVSAFNYFAISKSEQPADEKFNYGKGKIEALGFVIEGTVITVSFISFMKRSAKRFTKKRLSI